MPQELRRFIAHEADQVGLSFSAVVTSALAAWARGRLIDTWLSEHQTAHGTVSENELKALANDARVPHLPPAAVARTTTSGDDMTPWA